MQHQQIHLQNITGLLESYICLLPINCGQLYWGHMPVVMAVAEALNPVLPFFHISLLSRPNIELDFGMTRRLLRIVWSFSFSPVELSAHLSMHFIAPIHRVSLL